MATALVTGASGFVGGHVVETLLARGERVRCLVRRTSQIEMLRPLNVELLYGDLFDLEALREAVEGVDVVYHLAALTCALNFSDLRRANVEGTANVARACAGASPPPVLVLVSSVAAAGPVSRRRIRRETDRPAPVSSYGRSKRAGELAAHRYAGKLPVTVVRPGIVFGPRNRELFPVFDGIDRFGVHLIPTFSPPPLSLIHVTDLVTALLAAAASGERLPPWPPGSNRAGEGCYFANTNEYPDYRQLGRLIGQVLQRRRVRLWCLAEPLPWIIAGANELASQFRGRPDLLNIDKIREATVESWACSSEKVQTQLAWQPGATLLQRLAETAQWYRQQGWLR